MPGQRHAPEHGSHERWLRGCRCAKCVRTRRLMLRLRLRYPSLRDPAEALTDPQHPAFWRLLAAVRGIPMTVERAAGVLAQAQTELTETQTERLMQPDIPPAAWTKRRLRMNERS